MFQQMQAFITSAFMYEPPVRRYNDIHNKVIKEIKAGKSGACVYELENNCILKTYLPRDHNEYFKTGTAQAKRDKYVKHRYEYAVKYIRSIRDIVMASILPDSMSPKVYDYGFVKTDKGLQPFMIMEKVRGVDLFTYTPTGTDRDIRILSNIVGAVRQFNECIRSYNPAVIPCHKDLHPHNIMVNPYNNEVKLIDFDLSTCPYDLYGPTIPPTVGMSTLWWTRLLEIVSRQRSVTLMRGCGVYQSMSKGTRTCTSCTLCSITFLILIRG